MNTSTNRLLKPEHLPRDLWNGDYCEDRASEKGLIKLPSCLATAYNCIVDRFGLRVLSESRDPNNSPVGGLSQEETDMHFAQAFDGSSARVQLALTDPFNKAAKASNNLVRSLSGNRVILADTPSGAGAAAFSLLATIAHLRAAGVLPRVPLDIHLVGGEISEPARSYAEHLAEELAPSLEDQAITLTHEFRAWDVTDELSNTDLVGRLNVAANGRDRKLLIIANFNGFLMKGGKQKKAKPQLTELIRHCSGADSYAVWIEPDMNRATAQGGLFHWLRGLLASTWSRFAREELEDEAEQSTPICCCRFELPLIPAKTARVGLSLMPLNLTRTL